MELYDKTSREYKIRERNAARTNRKISCLKFDTQNKFYFDDRTPTVWTEDRVTRIRNIVRPRVLFPRLGPAQMSPPRVSASPDHFRPEEDARQR